VDASRASPASERLKYDAPARQVRDRSDKSDGPTAGTETVDPLEFLARLSEHIPNTRQVMTRYYGYYANRVRGTRRRWAELLRQIFEVDPRRCPACGAEMRIVAFVTQRAVIDRILDHLRRGRESAREPPSVQKGAQRRARVHAGRQRA
jgi:hypothetical protein